MRRFRDGLRADRSSEIPKLLTLTSRPGEAPHASRSALADRFARLRRILTRRYPGLDLEYAGVPELTRAGALHFHVVLLGVPFVAQSTWSRWAARAGFGFVVDVRRVRGHGGMSGYLSKYLGKQLGGAHWPAHFRRVRFSQSYAPDWVSRPRSGRQDGAWVLLRFRRGERWDSESDSALMATAYGPP
jgi:hypothetical protein